METVLELREGSTVADLLERLLEIFPSLGETVLPGGRPAPYHRVTVNGRDVYTLYFIYPGQ